MESPPQELDEDKLDAAIADILKEEGPEEQIAEPVARPEFPDLKSQEDLTALFQPKKSGVTDVLRQKWAELSGAA